MFGFVSQFSLWIFSHCTRKMGSPYFKDIALKRLIISLCPWGTNFMRNIGCFNDISFYGLLSSSCQNLKCVAWIEAEFCSSPFRSCFNCSVPNGKYNLSCLHLGLFQTNFRTIKQLILCYFSDQISYFLDFFRVIT